MKENKPKIDLVITMVPFLTILILAGLFFIFPEASNVVLGKIRFFFGDTVGEYYLVLGLGMFLVSLIIAFSKYGRVVLGGKEEKPKYSFFSWGCMMFTCGLAADILFYSMSEWVMYANEEYVQQKGDLETWSAVYPIFHWSLIPWSFYLVLAAAFGYMLHVRLRNRQRYSEACRPLLGEKTDGVLGRVIDLLAVFALLAGTATTFCVATPLMSAILKELFGWKVKEQLLTMGILVVTCCVYTFTLLHEMKGMSILANVCIFMFFGLLGYVLFFGGEFQYIVETTGKALLKMVTNFFSMSTYSDPERTTSFPQNWTIYYWSYWIVWCVAAPFFIGMISKGRTVRQVILGGYGFGCGSTVLSFSILGNYSMGLQFQGTKNFIESYGETGDAYGLVVSVVKTLPCAPFVLVLILLTMIAFYSTSFDSIAYTASCYSYKKLEENEKPHTGIMILWCVLLIVLPMALIFSGSTMGNLQAVSIIAAFPVGIVLVLIVVSFLKELREK